MCSIICPQHFLLLKNMASAATCTGLLLASNATSPFSTTPFPTSLFSTSPFRTSPFSTSLFPTSPFSFLFLSPQFRPPCFLTASLLPTVQLSLLFIELLDLADSSTMKLYSFLVLIISWIILFLLFSKLYSFFFSFSLFSLSYALSLLHGELCNSQERSHLWDAVLVRPQHYQKTKMGFVRIQRKAIRLITRLIKQAE